MQERGGKLGAPFTGVKAGVIPRRTLGQVCAGARCQGRDGPTVLGRRSVRFTALQDTTSGAGHLKGVPGGLPRPGRALPMQPGCLPRAARVDAVVTVRCSVGDASATSACESSVGGSGGATCARPCLVAAAPLDSSSPPSLVSPDAGHPTTRAPAAPSRPTRPGGIV